MNKPYEFVVIPETFELTSTRLLCTDPCYDKNSIGSYIIENAKPGTWSSTIVKSNEGGWGMRVAELQINILDDDDDALDAWAHEPIPESIGVDSGQAGFFDYDKYPETAGEYGDGESFYDAACKVTYDEKDRTRQAGIVEGIGVNSSSGFGDGSYDLYVGRNSIGQVVSARLVFFYDKAEEDDGDDYD
jgi:hypothetical protein